jgi:5-(carboxyamino)imidazole ribonucleotide synthase
MFAIAARRLGYRVHVFSPDRDTPAGQVCDREWSASYHNVDALAEFARSVSVVTLEFENVSVAAVDVIERTTPVRPGAAVLHAAQHRSREKTMLQSLGLRTAPFRIVRELNELVAAIGAEPFHGQGILKTAASGYDGKGQVRLNAASEAEAAWQTIGRQEAVLEGIVDFECELSVIGVRGVTGEFTSFGPILNEHANHILDLSIAPAIGIPDRTAAEAIEMTRTIMESLDVVGVLCVEFFLDRSGQLVINEIAPRPHNSGHLTIDAHITCQFEQQVRSVCGLPLGSTEQRQPAAMANLLGDVWEAGEPRWAAVLAMPRVKLHLYGKSEARLGRKMGHLTALADTPELAATVAREARAALSG